MDILDILRKVKAAHYVFSQHAELEREAEELAYADIEIALLNGVILEQYEDTGRGESCLVLGFCKGTPIHMVCGWRGDDIALITVYVPTPPKFVDPWTRRETRE